MVSLLCHSRPIFPLLFSRKSRTIVYIGSKDKRWIFYTVFAYMRFYDSVQSFKVSRTSSLKVKTLDKGSTQVKTLDIINYSSNRKVVWSRIFPYFFSRTWRLIYFCVDQSLQDFIGHNDIAYLTIDIEYNVILFVEIIILMLFFYVFLNCTNYNILGFKILERIVKRIYLHRSQLW